MSDRYRERGGRDYHRDGDRMDRDRGHGSNRPRSPPRRQDDRGDRRPQHAPQGSAQPAQRTERPSYNANYSRKRARSPSPRRPLDLTAAKAAITSLAHSAQTKTKPSQQSRPMQAISVGSKDAIPPSGRGPAVPLAEVPSGGVQEDEEDLDIDLDLLDPEQMAIKQANDLLEAAKAAEERRKRLDDIKAKHASVATDVSSADTVPSANIPEPTDAIDESYANDLIQLVREQQAAEEEDQQHAFAFDMFSNSPTNTSTHTQHTQAATALTSKNPRPLKNPLPLAHEEHLSSNWDDSDGYYKPTISEIIGDRFQVLGVLGKGVFSTVLKCKDLLSEDVIVACKIIRNNEVMRKAADTEIKLLLQLQQPTSTSTSTSTKHIISLQTYLEYRHHMVMVFEYQEMNLREILKKFGSKVGINITAVRIYGKQLFLALKHLQDLGIIHADIKLDNILISADLKVLKVCDFGSAFKVADVEKPTPYLVSRFYRAPEIILGMPYSHPIDLWSVCVSLHELFTGHILFPGRTNNEMLRLIMEVTGRLPTKLIRTHLRAYEALGLEGLFEGEQGMGGGGGRFKAQELDGGKVVTRLINVPAAPTKDLGSILRSSKAGADGVQLVQQFTDLLERGLAIDPSKRLTVMEALRHPFFAKKTA